MLNSAEKNFKRLEKEVKASCNAMDHARSINDQEKEIAATIFLIKELIALRNHISKLIQKKAFSLEGHDNLASGISSALRDLNTRDQLIISQDSILKDDLECLLIELQPNGGFKKKDWRKLVDHMLAEINCLIADDQRMSDESPALNNKKSVESRHVNYNAHLQQALQDIRDKYLPHTKKKVKKLRRDRDTKDE